MLGMLLSAVTTFVTVPVIFCLHNTLLMSAAVKLLQCAHLRVDGFPAYRTSVRDRKI